MIAAKIKRPCRSSLASAPTHRHRGRSWSVERGAAKGLSLHDGQVLWGLSRRHDFGRAGHVLLLPRIVVKVGQVAQQVETRGGIGVSRPWQHHWGLVLAAGSTASNFAEGSRFLERGLRARKGQSTPELRPAYRSVRERGEKLSMTLARLKQTTTRRRLLPTRSSMPWSGLCTHENINYGHTGFNWVMASESVATCELVFWTPGKHDQVWEPMSILKVLLRPGSCCCDAHSAFFRLRKLLSQ